MRREVAVLAGSVLAVHAVFVAVYFLARLRGAEPNTRLGFTTAWTVATLAVVLVGLARVRRARRGTQRAAAGGRGARV